MTDPQDDDDAKRGVGSEDETLSEHETLGPEPAMHSIRGAHGEDVDPGVDLDESAPVPTPGSSRRRYTVRGEIARGGMGAIFKVRDEDLRRSVAMKVLLGQVSRDPGKRPPFEPQRLARFLEEAQVTAQLAHPGVVPVHELGVDETGRVFFTMSLVRGKTLSEIIQLARENKGGWDRPRALNTLLRVCETMAFAHDKGVIHRDLKPANIMVGKFGEVYVMDWGLAKVRGQEDRHDIRPRPREEPTSTRIETRRADTPEHHESPVMTMDGAVVGTPAYMPPEQAKGMAEQVDERSDVYAIGAMLYQLLTGRAPYVEPGARMSPYALLASVAMGPPPAIHELAPDAPEELQAIANKAMARNRVHRYDSAQSMAEDVQRFLSGRVVLAHRTGALIELRKWVARNRGLAGTAAVALVTIAGVVGVFLVSLSDERDRALRAERVAEDRARDVEHERQRADERATEAEGERERARVAGLVLAARDASQSQPTLGLLLAREARRRRPSIDSTQALRDALRVAKERRRLVGHSARVNDAVFAPTTGYLATASDDGTARVWDSAGTELARLEGHRGRVRSVAFSPSGEQIATAGSDAVRVWEASGRERAVIRLSVVEPDLSTHPAMTKWAVTPQTFAPSGERIVVGYQRDGSARVSDLDGNELLTLQGHGDYVRSASFSSTGGTLLTGSDDKTARIWDANGRTVAVLSGHESGVGAVMFSRTGALVLTVTHGNVARVWDVAHGGAPILITPADAALFSPRGDSVLATTAEGVKLVDIASGRVHALPRRPGAAVSSASFAPAALVVAGSYDWSAYVWTTSGKEAAVLRGHSGAVTSARFSADGGRVLTASADGTARIWDLTGEEHAVLGDLRGRVSRRTVSITHTGGSMRLKMDRGRSFVAFSPDGDRVVGSSADGAARVWRVTGDLVAVLEGDSGRVNSAEYSPDGKRIVTASSDGTARIWSASGREIAVLKGHADAVAEAVWAPAGDLLLTASRDGTARTWSPSGEAAAVLRGHVSAMGTPLEQSFRGIRGVDTARFSPDGTRMVTASKDYTSRVYDRSGRVLAVLRGHKLCVNSADFSPTGDQVVTASDDGTARVWADNGQELAVLRGHEDDVYFAAWSRAGDRILTGSRDHTARLWSADGTAIKALRGHSGGVEGGAFLPDGGSVATASSDGTVRLWDTYGNPVAVLRGHVAAVNSVAISPAGDLIATASDDGTVRLWITEPDGLLELAERRLQRDFTDEERGRYVDLLGSGARER